MGLMTHQIDHAESAARRDLPALVGAEERWRLAGPHPLRDKRRATRRRIVALGAASPPGEWWLAHVWMLVDALEVGDRARVDTEVRACRRIADESQDASLRVHTTTWEATLALLSGRLEDAELRLRSGLGEAEGPGLDRRALEAHLHLLARERGKTDPRAPSPRLAVLPARSPTERAVLAERLVASGRTEEAAFEIERLALDSFAHVPRDHDWLASMVRIAAVCPELGRSDLAAEVRRHLRPFRDRTVVGDPLHALFLGAVAHYTGVLAAVMGQPDAALVDLATAAEVHEELGARLWLNVTRCEQARVLLGRGEPGDEHAARQVLAGAEEEAADLGLSRIQELAGHLLGRGAEPAVADPSFRRQGDGWSVSFWSQAVHLGDSKGMRGLHHLLERPETAVSASAIVRDVLCEDAPGDAERARVNVTRQIRGAIRAIGDHLPDLAAHLDGAVATGRRCVYRPAQIPPWRL